MPVVLKDKKWYLLTNYFMGNYEGVILGINDDGAIVSIDRKLDIPKATFPKKAVPERYQKKRQEMLTQLNGATKVIVKKQSAKEVREIFDAPFYHVYVQFDEPVQPVCKSGFYVATVKDGEVFFLNNLKKGYADLPHLTATVNPKFRIRSKKDLEKAWSALKRIFSQLVEIEGARHLIKPYSSYHHLSDEWYILFDKRLGQAKSKLAFILKTGKDGKIIKIRYSSKINPNVCAK